MQEFKKLSHDKMSKLILSNKKYMNWFLERFLEKKIENYKIINKIDNKEINQNNIIELLKDNIPINIIQRATGYSQEYILSLKS